jgi:hypothetical protein
MTERSGRCACGATTYTLCDEPEFSYLCQCRQCQKSSGSGHAALMMVAREALSIDGPLKTHEQRSDSGKIVGRRFCQECGTPIVLESSGYPHLLFVTAGSRHRSFGTRLATHGTLWIVS